MKFQHSDPHHIVTAHCFCGFRRTSIRSTFSSRTFVCIGESGRANLLTFFHQHAALTFARSFVPQVVSASTIGNLTSVNQTDGTGDGSGRVPGGTGGTGLAGGPGDDTDDDDVDALSPLSMSFLGK